MGKNTDISWTDHSWNPWQGCKKVSSGCKNCYMFDGQRRWGNDPENIHRSAKQTFNMPLRLKKPCKVFTCSWSDFFLKEADQWRDDAWDIIRRTPHITYQILTKRPENIKDRLPDDWPFKNVWLGVSAETQDKFNERVPYLLFDIVAEKIFVSIEPMLEPIYIGAAICETYKKYGLTMGRYLDWVICGGESGPHYRDMEVSWAMNLKEICQSTGTPFFMKQMSAVNPKVKPIPDYLNVKEFPI